MSEICPAQDIFVSLEHDDSLEWSFEVVPEVHEQVVTSMDQERFHASGNWGTSSWAGDSFGEFYRFTTPNTEFSDPASYRFEIPEQGEYTFYAWNPTDPGYNVFTPVGVATTQGIEWTLLDQRSQGGQWIELGTYEMAAGDDWNVLVSRWAPGDGLVIADAIKVEQQ